MNELIVLISIIFLKFIPQKNDDIKKFLRSLEWLLIVMMPSIALIDVLDEIQVPWYLSILVFVFVFVGWAIVNWTKYHGFDKFITFVFIGIVSSPIIWFIVGYCLSHGLL
jgi:hypothetical protein